MLKKQNGSLLFLAVATISCVLCFSGSAIGSGFAIIEQSAASAGYAYAGVAAAAQDASTIFFNPAAAAAFAQAAGLVNTTATADVTLPETVSISGYHAFNERWAILADVTWTKWSRLDELRIKFGSWAADSVTTLEWDDTWRYSLGGSLNRWSCWNCGPVLPSMKRRFPTDAVGRRAFPVPIESG